jgi:hypothetical protein
MGGPLRVRGPDARRTDVEERTVEIKTQRSDAEWRDTAQKGLTLAKRACRCTPRGKETGGQTGAGGEVEVCPPCQARGALNALDGALEAATRGA